MVTGPDVLGGKGTPDVAALPLHTGTSQGGRELPVQLQTTQEHDYNGPQERLQSWQRNSQRRQKKAKQEFDSGNSLLAHSREKNIRPAEELPH